MNKPIKQRSELLESLRRYFRIHKNELYVLSDKQRGYLDNYIFCPADELPRHLPSSLAIELTKCALIVRRENKKLRTIAGKTDYIEGLDMHNTHPKLYNLCFQLKIHTITELDVFINAIRSGSTPSKEFMRQYPLIYDLIAFYDDNRRNHLTPHNLSTQGTRS